MGNIIPYIRRKRNIKQSDMAKALDVSPSYLCKVEKGIQEPTEKFKDACCEYLKIIKSVLFPDVKKKKNEILREAEFKNNLWPLRMSKGIKQNELAKLLDCTPSYLSKVEKGFQKPNSRFQKKCARILKVKETVIFPSTFEN